MRRWRPRKAPPVKKTAEIASFDGSEKPLLALKNNDCIGYVYDQTFIAGKLTDDDWKGGYHMPLPGIMETPWAALFTMDSSMPMELVTRYSK